MTRQPVVHGGSAGRIAVDGRVLEVTAGTRLSAVLWGAGWRTFSTHPVTGQPRGPLCGMGVCHECQVLIRDPGPETSDPDKGIPGEFRSARACLEPVADGMIVSLADPIGNNQ